MCQTEHLNSRVTLLKLGSMNTLCSFNQPPSAFLKCLPVLQSQKMPESSSKKQGRISYGKNTTARGVQTNPPQNAGLIYLFFFQVYQTDQHFLDLRNTRTSSTCIILLGFLSWHLTSSWMHHVSRHKTLLETSYKVLMNFCGHYKI